MNCMKCGREIKGEDIFCPECTAEMDRYPVKPGTLVNLPRRTVIPVKKPSRRRVLKPEELILRQRNTIRWLLLVLVVLIFAFAFLAFLLVMILAGIDAGDILKIF